MTITCSDIIARALRMARVTAIGEEASADEENEGMIALLSIYSRLADTAIGPVEDIYSEDDVEAEENQRIHCATGTVTLPDLIGHRRPYDLAAVQ
jgi:hypothetical protein